MADNTEMKKTTSVIAARISTIADTDTTLTEEEQKMWDAMKEERDSYDTYNRRRFKILLVVYIILFIAFIIYSVYVIRRMIDWDFFRKLVALNSKTIGTRDMGLQVVSTIFTWRL